MDDYADQVFCQEPAERGPKPKNDAGKKQPEHQPQGRYFKTCQDHAGRRLTPGHLLFIFSFALFIHGAPLEVTMTDITERKIDYKELARMVIVCKGCKAEVTLDVSNQEQWQAILAKRSRLACTVCGDAFDSAMPEAIGSFAAMHDRLFRAGHDVFFRVKQT